MRPFQRQALDAIADTDVSLVSVEAPVGSGKSFIIRRLFETHSRSPLVLTYPTNILLRAQIGALQKECAGLSILPWDRLSPGSRALVEYSGATLIEMARGGRWRQFGNRSDLLNHLFQRIGVMEDPRFVMTADVLHLIVNKEFYKGSRHLQRGLKGAVFVFDEFHLYHELGHFYALVADLLSKLEGKVVLLSATPLGTERLRELAGPHRSRCVDFAEAAPDDPGSTCKFNHSLSLRLHDSFPTGNVAKEADLILAILGDCEKPAAVILDSIFRLRHLLRRVRMSLTAAGLRMLEWHGEKKESIEGVDDRSIVFGTAAIEVGIDMDFRTLIMEASQWSSAVQRLGRVGRKHPGTVHFITRQRVAHLLGQDAEVSRTDLEQRILRNAFRYEDASDDKLAASAASEMFRGDSYAFALYDEDMEEVYFGDEALFARYRITDEGCEDWRCLSRGEKADELRSTLHIPARWEEEILLRDSVFPFWGVLRGRLADEYMAISAAESKRTGALTIHADKPYVFYRK